jgi:hypothetical protein
MLGEMGQGGGQTIETKPLMRQYVLKLRLACVLAFLSYKAGAKQTAYIQLPVIFESASRTSNVAEEKSHEVNNNATKKWIFIIQYASQRSYRTGIG